MSLQPGAVILAAGRSLRMGAPKARLPLHGEAMLHRVARLALQAGLDPVVVVVPPEPSLVTLVSDLAGVRTALPSAVGSPGDSLRAGIRALPSACDGAVVLLGDMPFVSPHLLRALARCDTLAAADHAGEPGPPWRVPRTLVPEIIASRGSRPLRHLAAHRAVTRLAATGSELRDLDTPDDYARAAGELGRG